MLLKFFWMYIGSFFACSVALIFVAKNYADSFASKSKHPVLWGGVSSTAISGGAYLATYITDHLFTVYWVLSFIFLLFGAIHVIFFHKRYFASNKNNRNKVFIGEILFALSLILFAVVVFSALQYFLKGDKDFMFFPMLLSMLSFFVPITLLYTFEAAYKIPPPEFATWYYPVKTPIELPDEKANEKLLVIAFEIAKNPADVRTNFRAKGPETMVLGDLFYHFVNDYNDMQSETPIKYTDKQDHPHEWWFRIKPKWFQGQRILDPDLSIKDN
ncbi:MAG: TssN family type VI secretion system protein, partial [Ferruginibacter sp.]